MHTAKKRNAQSLMEVLMAMTLGMLLLLAASAVLVPAVRISGRTAATYAGTSLARDELDAVRVWAERDWDQLLALSPDPNSHYYLDAAHSPFLVVSGDELVIVSGTVYTRYFFVENVFRDAAGFITSATAPGALLDPATRKIVAVWQPEGLPSNTLSLYLTRYWNP